MLCVFTWLCQICYAEVRDQILNIEVKTVCVDMATDLFSYYIHVLLAVCTMKVEECDSLRNN